MPPAVFTIRPSSSLRDFLAVRVLRTDRGARGPWTRTGVLEIAVERYERILRSLRLPEPPRDHLSEMLEAVAPFPIPSGRLAALPALLRVALGPFAADPAVGYYLGAVDQLELVELVGLAEALEAEARQTTHRPEKP